MGFWDAVASAGPYAYVSQQTETRKPWNIGNIRPDLGTVCRVHVMQSNNEKAQFDCGLTISVVASILGRRTE